MSIFRQALKDVTLLDGTFIPKGTIVSIASNAMHRDDAHYPDEATFDPFRFARMREGEGEELKHQFASTSPDYLPFGHGRHSWCVVCTL